jgi:subtilisin family serine protease
VLCAAPLLAAPAHAFGATLQERQALRAALGHEAATAKTGRAAPPSAPRAANTGRAAPHPRRARIVPLPLPERAPSRATAASARAELVRVARAPGPQRVLVGVRRHSDVAAVSRALVRLGAAPEAFESIGVLAATVPSGAGLVRALGADPRVAYVERDTELRIAADPLDAVDPLTGIKYTWAYDAVRAADALFAAGGGSRRSIAVLDTGLDVNHPEFAGRVSHTFDTATRSADVFDAVGHGTFVTGLIAAIDGNGVGGKGVAGNTFVLAIRASLDGGFDERDLLRGIEFAIRRGADVLNMSLAGNSLHPSVARALAVAFFNDVLPVAASGNLGARGNPVQFPAAVVGGVRGRPGIGLSVAATRPDGRVPAFSTHNRFVSLAAPGAGPSGCEHGVLSTLPAGTGTEWDDIGSCSRLVPDASGARFAYGEGTSFAAPIASGIAALVWQVEPRLASEQVADVLTRSARQIRGRGWNEFTGDGLVDGLAGTRLARRYDVTSPRPHGSAVRRGALVNVRVGSSRDRTERGRERAGRVRYSLLVSRDGGRGFDVAVNRSRRPFRRAIRLRGGRVNVILMTTCDANGNCGVKRLGRFRLAPR